MKKHIFLIAIFFVCLRASFAEQWNNRFTGTGNAMDEIKSMVVDNAGNVYVTGYSFSGVNDNDYVTIKYSTTGVRQWLVRYDGNGHGSDVPTSIFVDGSGNVYVTGSSDQLTGTYINNDAATVKYNSQGVQQWVRRFDGVRQRADAGNTVKADGSGNVYITGYTTVNNGAYTKKDYLTIKYSATGEQVWIATYNGPANQDDEAVSLGLDPSGNVYVTGTSFAGKDPVGENDYLTIKYSPSGVQQWTARYNGPISEADRAFALAVDNSGNVYVTGYSRGGNGLDFATIKYNTSGVQQWVARYDGSIHGSDIAYAIKVDGSGNVYVAGGDQSVAYNTDFRTIKYNSSGQIQWTAKYNGPANDNDEAYALAIDGTGNVYVTGYVNGVSPSWDIATIKYSSSGGQQWVKRFDGPGHGNDSGNAIGVDGSGNVYVSGGSTGTNTGLDFITLKYSSSGAKTEFEGSTEFEPESYILYQNAPNPFDGVTKIKFNLPANKNSVPSKVKLVVYNIEGYEAATLINAELETGSYEAEWNATAFSPGIYFYRLSSDEFQEVKKMIVE